jgi:hypothetical protein
MRHLFVQRSLIDANDVRDHKSDVLAIESRLLSLKEIKNIPRRNCPQWIALAGHNSMAQALEGHNFSPEES